jgi:8-oxo-dGTP pyrophosphatase MutT (NUDIX family)
MPKQSGAANLMISILRRHEPANADEAANRERTLAWLAAAVDPLNRNEFNPGHAVGSALITTPDKRHVMLVLHAKLNRWLQAGGHAEQGETDPVVVARREALEEVGCAFPPGAGRFCDIDIHVVPARRNEPEHLHFDFRYLFEAPLSAGRAASDALEARWFTLPEATALDIDSGLRRMIGKLRV